MLMVCHHLNSSIPEDLAFAESRIRPTTMAAEDVLHDLGAISMIGSDSQAMGRIGETIIRTWQTAHVMKQRRGALPGDGGADHGADNMRARRYVAKYTIGPAVTHGLDEHIGSVQPGKLADLVLWEPAFFGVRPHVVLKAGVIAWATMGDANASIPTPQPQLPRPMFGAFGAMPARLGLHFVSPAALEAGLAEPLGQRPAAGPGPPTCPACPRPACRRTTRLPDIDVDPETFAVRVDGELIEPLPGHRTAHGPALLPVLTPDEHAAAAPARLPGPGGRAPPLRRDGGRGPGPGWSPAWPAWTDFCRAKLRTSARVGAAFAAASARLLSDQAERVRGARAGSGPVGHAGRRVRGAHAIGSDAHRVASAGRGAASSASFGSCPRRIWSRRSAGARDRHPITRWSWAPGSPGRAGRRTWPRGPRRWPPARARPARRCGCSAWIRSPCRAMLARLAPDIDECAAPRLAAVAAQPSALPADAAPALDLLADFHLTAEVRLFAS